MDELKEETIEIGSDNRELVDPATGSPKHPAVNGLDPHIDPTSTSISLNAGRMPAVQRTDPAVNGLDPHIDPTSTSISLNAGRMPAVQRTRSSRERAGPSYRSNLHFHIVKCRQDAGGTKNSPSGCDGDETRWRA